MRAFDHYPIWSFIMELMKRAAAHRAGLHDLESKLRDRIAWSLPVRRGREDEPSGDGLV